MKVNSRMTCFTETAYTICNLKYLSLKIIVDFECERRYVRRRLAEWETARLGNIYIVTLSTIFVEIDLFICLVPTTKADVWVSLGMELLMVLVHLYSNLYINSPHISILSADGTERQGHYVNGEFVEGA